MAAPTYIAQGGAVAVTTSASPSYPAGLASGDVLLMFVVSDATGIAGAPVGWTALNGGAVQSGGGLSCRSWYRIATGSESGAQTVPVTSGTKGVAWISAYRPPAGTVTVTGGTGSDTDTSSSAYSATGASWTLAIDHMVVGMAASLAQAAGAYSGSPTGQGLTNAGAAGTHTARFGGRTATNTIAYTLSDLAITSGGTGAPTHVFTAAGANTAGVEQFARISVAANVAPIASAGSNQTVTTGATVTLDGTGSSDPDGPSVTYAWTQTAGTAVSLSSTTAAKPTFTAPSAAGTLTFSLTVTDTGGASSSASSVTVTVNAPADTANAGPDQAVPGWATVTLAGSGSAVGSWSIVAGAATLDAGSGATRTFAAVPSNTPGATASVTARYTVGTATDDVIVSVGSAGEFHLNASAQWRAARSSYL